MKEWKDNEPLIEYAVSYFDDNSAQYIDKDGFQHLKFPKEYPALIVMHMEHPPQDVPLHQHPSSELIYSRNREIAVTIDGEKKVIHPGEFLLISSYALHAVIPSKNPGNQDVMSITFQTSYLQRMLPDIREMKISREAPGATLEAVREMESLCEQLREQVLQGRNQTKQFETNRLLYEILKRMYSDFFCGMQEWNQEKERQREKITNLLSYLEEHYQDRITTQMIADRMGYSREYFCKFFKRYSNQTFKQYLTQIRLERAVEKLRESKEEGETILKIALDSGFPDEKSFFYAFRKQYGKTPAQFRGEKNK